MCQGVSFLELSYLGTALVSAIGRCLLMEVLTTRQLLKLPCFGCLGGEWEQTRGVVVVDHHGTTDM